MNNAYLPPLANRPASPSLPTRVRLKLKRIYLDLTGPRIDREWRRAVSLGNSIDGWLYPEEERWLFNCAYSLPSPATVVEVGSFKGRSTCFLASGCRETDKRVFAVDTFNGNDGDFGYRDFFDDFSRNIERCGLSKYVQPILGASSEVATTWNKPIHLLFIDASHAYEDVLADFAGFFPHVVRGGIVALHDVYNPERAGVMQAWKEIKNSLTEVGRCRSIAYGFRGPVGEPPTGDAR